MEITTPLGEDVLMFLGMHGREELGRLSDFQVELLSERNDIDLDEILGQNVTVRMALSEDASRYFNGYVTRFGQHGTYGRYHRYSATVRPWLWFLTRTADCRIFQDMTVPDILRQVFADHTMADFAFELTGSYRQWTYCVQYRETDFNFVSRLMEQEGIYYYFRHTDGHDTLVLTDSTGRHRAAPGYEQIRFVAPEQFTRPEAEYITGWSLSREVQPGLYVHDDYDFERPSVELQTRRPQPRSYTPSSYEVYDYPGEYVQASDGTQYATVRMDEFGTQFETAEAVTNCRGLGVGHLFTLDGCPRSDQDREHLVVAASYDLTFGGYEGLPQGEGGASFSCTFTAMPSQQQFRPARTTPKPFVQGPQTAVVVGPGGDEIYTDRYGRVKVQFHWDRRGRKDENSSCWTRVSYPWAGKTWGGIHIPRIGQEVIVDFLEGDPDQPIITGRVYNAEQMPPYDLPANKTQSGVKSRSSKGGGPANFNEIRFEDKTGAEQLYIHAEKNQDIVVENDETHSVGHDRTKTIGHDETTHVKHDRTETVDNDETITIHANRTETVDKDETISIHQNRTETVDLEETITIGGNRSITVGKSETATVTLQRTHTVGINESINVGAAQEITVGGMQAITVGAVQTTSVGANRSASVGSNDTLSVSKNRSIDVGQADTLHVGKDRTTDVKQNDTLKAGKTITVEAGDKIVIKAANEIKITVGQASMVLKKSGQIEIKGMKIDIKGSQAVKQEGAQITSDASAINTIKGGLVKIN
jgi:type VI secretion system secreted protein VgrG